MNRYIDAEKIRFFPLSVKICGNKYDIYGAEPERVITEIHDIVAYKGDIDAIPTADVEEVRHGRWINGVCSNCKTDKPIVRVYMRRSEPIYEYDGKLNYCPNCGARMDKEKEE